MSDSMALDRIAIGQLEFAPRSAILHQAAGVRPGRANRWWVTLAAHHLPDYLDRGMAGAPFCGWTVSGRMVRGTARVVNRESDAYGTTLTLLGLGPLKP